MNVQEAHKKIDLIKNNLTQIKIIASFVKDEIKKYEEGNNSAFDINASMSVSYPKQNLQLQYYWKEIQQNVPPGFAIDGNLIRHLYWNMPVDWVDITAHDIPRELVKINEYKKQLSLIEYLTQLHPEVSRVSEIVLSGDIDAALKTVYACLDTRIRSYLKLRSTEPTVPSIGKAFKDGQLSAPDPENNDSARNFLQGVIGYYRSNIVHRPLSTHRNKIEASLSLFALAHEAFTLFNLCSNIKNSVEIT